ncbi:hypothetical protein [Mycolicibacterium sediminis]|uniref:Uncharacterized protein n=1 Tax=Mycolicibacterium sediminis TaxID=1286180 RepID=A0A7I7QKT2_9MYCO|nr:hypothetical protein [Mycolicibacterium sediminis]BBY26710.1 hypothetical protein MSEDJ_08060 [Mycolicibacterium sediminis]
MPDDLLRFVVGPASPSSAWLWVAGILTLLVVGWYVAVLTTTATSERDAKPGVVARANAALTRRRFARDARRVGERLNGGDLTGPAAAAELSRILREFLHRHTGTRAHYMQVDQVAAGELAPAAPLLLRLNDVQFNARSTEDAAALPGATEELISSWS